jgi:hypothetical protein
LGRKERYVLAMALLLVVGLASAWAGYSATTTISASSISSFVSVSATANSISLTGLKKNVWFYKGETKVFTITVLNGVTMNINVTVGVGNMGEIADKFQALDIYVKLNKSGVIIDQGVISLQGGISTVVLGASVSSGTYTVVVTISGRPAKSGNVNIIMYCSVQPAEAVQV